MDERKCEHFLLFAKRIEERVSIINRYIRDRIDLSENDMSILKELYQWYERDTIPWLTKELPEKQESIQKKLFVDG